MSRNGELMPAPPLSHQGLRELVQGAEVHALGQVRQLHQCAHPTQADHRRGLDLDAHGVLDGLGDQPVDHLGRQRDARRGQPGADPRRVHPTVRGRSDGAVRQPLRAHAVDDHRARPQVRGLEFSERVQGLGHRQVFEQRHQVHGRDHCDEENLLIGVTGDGVIVLESHSGCIDVYSISFPSGFPLYPTYVHQLDRFDAWAIKAEAGKEVQHFQAVSINEPVQLVGTSITNTSTEEFHLRAANYKHVALMTDGIHSFYCAQETATSKSLKSISLDHQLRELVSFRGRNGAFVARRVKKLTKEWTTKGWGHSDDLTIGAIYLGD